MANIVRLTDICDFQGGSQPPKEQWINSKKDGYIRMLQIRDFTQSNKVSPEYVKITATIKTCNSEDILIARYGASLGKILTGLSGAYNVAIMKTIPNEKVIVKNYLKYYLISDVFQSYILNVGTRAAQAGFNKEDLSSLFIKIVSIDEQYKVISCLDKITDLINLRKEQLSKLDELVKSRFVEMFGDVIYNDRHWKIAKLSDITTSRLGKMLDGKRQTGFCSFPYLANFNVQWFYFELNTLNRMDFSETDRVEFELKDGDLLVCEGGEIGRCAVWHNEIQPCYFQKALHRVRCNKKNILPNYLAWWFKYNCDHNGFSSIAGAKATIAHLPGVKLKSLNVVIPPIELQNQFTTFVEQIDKSKSEINKSLEKLELLKKSLMQKYFG